MEIKKGLYSAVYLLKTAKILKEEKKSDITQVQFFQREDNVVLCGIMHSLEIIKNESYDYKTLKIESLKDGDIVNSNEPVLKITGNLWKFIHLEGIIDGILARESSIATNARNTLLAAEKKEIIYMNDRSSYYFDQVWDGYAAYIGGIKKFVTEKQVEIFKKDKNIAVVGTLPHALIHTFKGDLILAMEAYAKHIQKNNLIALVDYNNDSIGESIKVAKHFKKKLFAVRVDTSKSLIDKSLEKYIGKFNKNELYGINYLLAKELRKELNINGFEHIKIIFSSGLNPERIKMLESKKAPIDFYGVGAFFSKIFINFTCDAVKLNNVLEAKYGRNNIVNNKLKVVKYD